MDPLTPIPKSEENNDTLEVLRNLFQEKLELEIFPLDIADNIAKYAVDDVLSLKETADNVIKVNKNLVIDSNLIKNVEREIIKEHGEYLIIKNKTMKDEYLREICKLKSCEIFKSYNFYDADKYGLIKKSDLYPDVIRQFLDFRFNSALHRCTNCFFDKRRDNVNIDQKTHCVAKALKKEKTPSCHQALSPSFKVEPSNIVFHNYHTEIIYERIIKVTNISRELQAISVIKFPKLSCFSLKFESQKIASGISVNAKISFSPKIFVNLEDEVSFRNSKGEIIHLPIKCTRDPPIINIFVYKSNHGLSQKHNPGSRNFSTKRRKTLNNTIDCGGCLATDYVLINLIVENTGNKGKFFLISEDDWYYRDVQNISTSMELTCEGFWIFPTYFEIEKNEISEISVIFQPKTCGFKTHILYLICDNNTYQQIEVSGDACCFNRNMISVNIPHNVKDIDKKEDHRIFLGYMRNREITNFTLSIQNKSSTFLKYYFIFEHKDQKNQLKEWIKIKNNSGTILVPYNTTEVIFEVQPDVDEEGYYNVYLSLFIKDVPIASLDENDDFMVFTGNRSLREIVENVSVVDVCFMKMEIACNIQCPKPKEEMPKVFECEKCEKMFCRCKQCKEDIPSADLVFSESLLDLGVFPVGVNLEKEFHLTNLSSKEKSWKLVEMRYNIDQHPYIEIIEENNLSDNFGRLLPEKKQTLFYKVIKKGPVRWVSILVLFSVMKNQTKEPNIIAESICVVTYEITELNIVVKTGQSRESIICPMQMLYTGVPLDLDLKVKNLSLITGCFYFLPPIGNEKEKVSVEYETKSGVLKPRSSRRVHLKLTCHDVGILENIFLPCFVGKGQDPILVRLLCVVDCVHVFFFLPGNQNEFQKILWPPKVVYEHDIDWSQYCYCEETSYEFEEVVKNIQSENDIKMMNSSRQTLPEIPIQKTNENKDTNVTLITETSTDPMLKSYRNLLDTLENVDSEIFLQDNVVEVYNVGIRKPHKFTIYFENVTPKAARYSVQSSNFSTKENRIQDILDVKYKTTEELWDPLIEEYGILVQPEVECGRLEAFELVSADIWIYSNTWGIYTEEIVVDIEDIACFTFSLLIEVVGCPLQLPLGLNAITKYPTIRLGSVPNESEDITRDIAISNYSSVPVNVAWHTFFCSDEDKNEHVPPFNVICDLVDKESYDCCEKKVKLDFDFTDQYYGDQSAKCIEVTPCKTDLESNCKTVLKIVFRPSFLNSRESKFPVTCYILGRIFLDKNDRMKSSYFYRKPNFLTIELTATLEQPSLDIEVIDDTNNIFLYANDVTLSKISKYYVKLLLRNQNNSAVTVELEANDPFSFEDIDTKVILGPRKCKMISVPCIISHEKILKWAPQVYKLVTEIKEFHQPNADDGKTQVHLEASDKEIDENKKILTLKRKLFLYYKERHNDVIPLNIHIYYPNVYVKPNHVKFGYVLIGRTQKTTISVFNLTGCKIMFEIYKSIPSQEILITPFYGEIDKSTGVNNTFKDIAIYFTPIECKNYQESIRIITNIPQYYIDIPIKGSGSFNEKFDGCYKT